MMRGASRSLHFSNGIYFLAVVLRLVLLARRDIINARNAAAAFTDGSRRGATVHFKRRRPACENEKREVRRRGFRVASAWHSGLFGNTVKALGSSASCGDDAGDNADEGGGDLDAVRRVFAISDLHTDNAANLQWLADKCAAEKGTELAPGPSDALIVAGDIAHELSTLKETLSILRSELRCAVFFVSGNHEAWIGGKEMDGLGLTSSLQKLDAVRDACRSLGVHTSNRLLGADYVSPVWVTPIDSWYDGTLTLPGCEDLTADFGRWPWVDFLKCDWGPSFRPDPSDVANGKIPMGLTEHILERNTASIDEVRSGYRSRRNGDLRPPQHVPGLITFSHFLPNQRSLPDWKDPQSDEFSRKEWLDHPVPEVSAKFSKVAGSQLIDEQIRSIVPPSMQQRTSDDDDRSGAVRHLHVFGHSHRPKDFCYRGIRYVHNPLGKPAEREMNMISKTVGFQLIWDTTVEKGEVPGEQIIRYWEEKGGGLDLLEENMRKNRRWRRGSKANLGQSSGVSVKIKEENK